MKSDSKICKFASNNSRNAHCRQDDIEASDIITSFNLAYLPWALCIWESFGPCGIDPGTTWHTSHRKDPECPVHDRN